ncbi:MAG TPA: hypothetical protein VKX17_07050 [Planctomycetota bacterium]|nr:hypothetical protein [Planctomycetota bacterium]
MRARGCVVFSLFVCAASSFAADWAEPKDGKFTETELTNYIGAQKDLVAYLKAAGKAVEGSSAAALAVLAGVDEKASGILSRNGLQRAEYDWLNAKVWESIGIIYVDAAFEKGNAELAERKKKHADDIAAAKAKLAAFEAAQRNGTHVLTKDQRGDLIKQAKEAQASALEEAKTHADEALAAAEEAAKAEADAKASDALAAKPPADVDADGKADYIKGKQEEAENFRTAAKEVREKEKEARKADAESKAKAAGFGQQAAHPEVPITPEEQEQVKNDNAQGVNDAKGELDTLKQAGNLIAEGEATVKKQTDEMHKNVNAENLALVKKHLKEIQDAMGMKDSK